MGGVEMTTGIFIQVRLGSVRLPRKALLPLTGGTVIEHAMRALKSVSVGVHALLTDEDSLEDLQILAENEGYEILAGPSDDVLKRFSMAARVFNVDRVVRATGDNPLVSPRMTEEILAVHHRSNADLSHFLGLPIGTGVEVIETETLSRCDRYAVDPFEREHITTHLYRNRQDFRVVEIDCPKPLQMEDAKVSIDTETEYRFVRHIYEELFTGKPIEIDSIASWLQDHVPQKVVL